MLRYARLVFVLTVLTVFFSASAALAQSGPPVLFEVNTRLFEEGGGVGQTAFDINTDVLGDHPAGADTRDLVTLNGIGTLTGQVFYNYASTILDTRTSQISLLQGYRYGYVSPRGNGTFHDWGANTGVAAYVLGGAGTPYDITVDFNVPIFNETMTPQQLAEATGAVYQRYTTADGQDFPGGEYNYTYPDGTPVGHFSYHFQGTAAGDITTMFNGQLYSFVRPKANQSVFADNGTSGVNSTPFTLTSNLTSTATVTVKNLSPNIASAPEAGSGALLLVGLVGMVGVACRKSRKTT